MASPRKGYAIGTTQLIKSINEGAVLKLVRDRGPITRADIVTLTGLTQPTVGGLLEELVEEGVIRPVGRGPSTGGRKPLLYGFNPAAALVIGVDVGGTKMAGGLTDLSGKVLARQTITQHDGPVDPYERLIHLIGSLLALAPPSVRIRGIGLGVAGVTNLANGMVTMAPALGWADFPLGAKLEERFGLPVFLDNDVNAILLGERWFGVAREVRHALCVAVGTGIGASIMMGGQIHRGADEATGEVGHVVTTLEALERQPVTRTAHGFLEEVSSGTGIARRGSQALGRDVTTVDVFRLAAEGNPQARQVVDEAAKHLGLALANMISLLNPQLLILTGGVMRSQNQLVGPIRAIIERLVPYPPTIVVSELVEEAGVLGAAGLVLEAARRSILVEA